MHSLQLKNLQFQKKSKRKAGEGKKSGLYKFFTSSNVQKSFVDEADFVGPALILGTGGSASIHYCDTEFSTSTDCFILKTDSHEIDLKYVYYYLVGNIDILEQGFKGAGLRHISKEYLCNLEIPLPPLPQQKHIIEKLDTLTELITLRKTSIQKTEELTKSVFIEMFGDPMINEKGWEVKELKELCDKITDGTHDTPERLQQGIMFITGKNIRQFSFDLSELDYVSQEEHNIIYKRCNPEFGDVLYTNIGVNLGNAVLNNFNFEFSMKNVALFKTIKNILNGYYLVYLLNHKNFKNRIISQNGKGGAQNFLSLDNLRKIIIPLPPLSLQNKFASIVEQNEETLRLQKESLKKLEELYAGVMQESFRI